MKKTFSQQAREIFTFLVEVFGYKEISSRNSERWPEGEGHISFQSASTYILISAETGGVGTEIARVKDYDCKSISKDGYKHMLDALSIFEYISLSPQEKEIVLSHNPVDQKRASEILLKYRFTTSESDNDTIRDIPQQLSEQARDLRTYASEFLRGDFSKWINVYEYKIRKIRAIHSRYFGKEEVSFVTEIGSDGKPFFSGQITLEQDYLEDLRKEYGKK